MIKQQNSFLYIFLGIIAVLLVVGIVFIYSASSVFALEMHGKAHYFVQKQIVGLFIGIFCLFFIQLFSIETIKKFVPITFFFSLFLTALTLLKSFARTIHGSSRWLKLGPLSFQPSELLKISFLLFLALYLSKKSFKRHITLKDYVPLGIITLLISIILLKQPDFGLTVTLLATTVILLFIARFPLKHIVIVLSSLIPLGIILIVLKPYRLKRILTFLNPWNDPKGAGFQIIQSLIAIGSGNIWGVGIANSKQKFFYLPMQHTDFIFSIIAEETGFIGSLFIVTLFILFAYFGFRLALSMNNLFSFFFTASVVVLISLQSCINIGVASGLLPTKGIGLPFISYGNSSLVVSLIMIGFIINMARD